jgi:hypothetical protein
VLIKALQSTCKLLFIVSSINQELTNDENTPRGIWRFRFRACPLKVRNRFWDSVFYDVGSLTPDDWD